MSGPPLLEVEKVEVHFRLPGALPWQSRRLRAVDGVSLSLAKGRTLGIVGESGCGKSTLARAILGLVPITSGKIRLMGRRIDRCPPNTLRPLRRHMQVVFQDPFAALDPRMTVGEIVAEPLRVFEPGLDRRGRQARVRRMLDRVGLASSHLNRYPHEFSGGQCQRIGIARALIVEPALLVCDEPVSALDVSVQAQIVNLLQDLQQEMGLALLFIAHDLAVVRQVSHEIMVMYLGRVVERAPRAPIYTAPRHPYTRALLEAVPLPDPERERARKRTLLQGDLPSPLEPPTGCAFHTRCPRAEERCRTNRPRLIQQKPRHWLACHSPLETF